MSFSSKPAFPYFGSNTLANILALTPTRDLQMWATDVGALMTYCTARSRWLFPGGVFVIGKGGTLAVPAASRTNAGIITMPNSLIRGRLVKAGDSLDFLINFSRDVTNTNSGFEAYLGTTQDSAAGSNFLAQTITAPASGHRDAVFAQQLGVGSSGSFFTPNWQAFGGQNDNPFIDLSTQVNWNANMYLSVNITTGPATAVHKVVSYRLTVNQLG